MSITLEGLWTWSTMGSSSEITSPRINNATGSPTITGSPNFTDGKFAGGQGGASGAYTSFDTVSTWLNPTTNPGTFEFWWKPTSGWTSSNHLITVTDDPGGGTAITINMSASGGNVNWYFRNQDSSTSYIVQSDPVGNYNQDQWYHIAWCWDFSGIGGGSDTVRAYLDGSVKYSTTTAAGPAPDYTASNWQIIGNLYSSTSTLYTRGVFDNVKMWDYAKTDYSDRFIEGYDYAKKRRAG